MSSRPNERKSFHRQFRSLGRVYISSSSPYSESDVPLGGYFLTIILADYPGCHTPWGMAMALGKIYTVREHSLQRLTIPKGIALALIQTVEAAVQSGLVLIQCDTKY